MSRVMKDSGVEWIGATPDGWTQQRLKDAFIGRCGGAWGIEKQEDNCDIVCIRVADFNFELQTVSEGEKTIRNYSLDQIDRLKLSCGDILIEKSGGGDKTPVGRTILFCGEEACVFSNFIERLRPKESTNYQYLGYLLKALYQSSYMYIYIKQTTGIQNLDIGSLLYEKICLPDFMEQCDIVSIVNNHCLKINHLIALQEDMISALQVYKQSVITEAVTKGLEPDVPMKDSGVEWIGRIPQEWDTVLLKTKFFINKRIAGKLGYNVLSVTQNGIKIKDITSNEGQISLDYSKYQLVYLNDYVMNHMDLLTGFVDISDYNGVTSPDYRVFTTRFNDICLRYYLHVFQTCYRNKIFYGLGQGVSGFGRWRLPAKQFMNFCLPVPSIEEQENIVAYIDARCAMLDQLISIKQSKIEALKEYKKSLIYECVTGKRDCTMGRQEDGA